MKQSKDVQKPTCKKCDTIIEWVRNGNKNKKSTFRAKRADTKMDTIEKQYGKDFGIRSDKELGSYLKEKGYNSLSELLKNA